MIPYEIALCTLNIGIRISNPDFDIVVFNLGGSELKPIYTDILDEPVQLMSIDVVPVWNKPENTMAWFCKPDFNCFNKVS